MIPRQLIGAAEANAFRVGDERKLTEAGELLAGGVHACWKIKVVEFNEQILRIASRKSRGMQSRLFNLLVRDILLAFRVEMACRERSGNSSSSD